MTKFHIKQYQCGHFSKLIIDAKMGEELLILIDNNVCPDCFLKPLKPLKPLNEDIQEQMVKIKNEKHHEMR